ncbi:MAG TPA: hypothetical protein VF669_03390 [Tepidisphaeraceae bacterium]|jgi:predicted RNA-binding Zn-ribbon protein involved in translation (DUF1610 family)
MTGTGWLSLILGIALLLSLLWIVVLLRRDMLDNERRKLAGLRRCVYCAYDLRVNNHRCPECGKIQPLRCGHCGQIILNGLSDHGTHCPMVVGAMELEDVVEQA